MKEKTACFTGHREIPEEEKRQLRERLGRTLEQWIEKGYCCFEAGGALGFDTLAALAVLEAKERHPHIKLILVLPCRNQTRGWKAADIQIYEEIRAAADRVVYTSEQYFSGCMHKRNRQLVADSSLCICYRKEPKGGTAYTVDLAEKSGLTVVNLA